jgi:hypothetical protein
VAVEGVRGVDACERHERGKPERLADFEADQRLADEVVGLVDDEVDALLDRPAQLLLVLRAHDRAGAARVRRVVGPGVADVGRDERAALGGDGVGHLDRGAVHLLQVALTPNCPELLAATITSAPARRNSRCRPSTASGASRITSGTNGPALTYPRRSSSKT